MEEGVKRLRIRERVTEDVLSAGTLIGLPSTRLHNIDWTLSLLVQSPPPNSKVLYCPIKGQDRNNPIPVAEARNLIVGEAKKQGCQYVLFVDDDTVPPYNSFRSLAYILEQYSPPLDDVGIIAGIYTTRSDPPEPLVFRGGYNGSYWNWKRGDIFEVTGLATGFMLVDMRVFDTIEPPYFATLDEDDPVKRQKFRQTDDLYFISKARSVGWKVLAHGGVLCVHWDYEKDKYYVLPETSYPMRPREPGDIASQEPIWLPPELSIPLEEQYEECGYCHEKHPKPLSINHKSEECRARVEQEISSIKRPTDFHMEDLNKGAVGL